MSDKLANDVAHKVVPYYFDNEDINAALAERNDSSCLTVAKFKKHLLVLKITLILAGILLTAMFEYMMFVSLWYRDPIFKGVMIFTPVLAGVIGCLVANVIDKTFDLNYGLFNSEFQFAYEKKYIYSFKGIFRGVQNEEKFWRNIIVGDYIWRIRDKVLNLKDLEGKEVILLLTRNFFDDDVDFECVYVKAM